MVNFGDRDTQNFTPEYRPHPGGSPPPRNLTDEDIQARANFTLQDHLKGSGRPDPFRQPPPSNLSPSEVSIENLKIDLNTKGVFVDFNLRERAGQLRQLGLDIWCDIVPFGEKPIDPAGKNQHRESKLIALQAEVESLRARAVTAESTAAMAVRELTELKAKTESGEES